MIYPNENLVDMNIIIVDHDRIDSDTEWSKKIYEIIRKEYSHVAIYDNKGSFSLSKNLAKLQEDIISKKPDIVIAHLGPSGLIFQERCDWVGCIIYVTSSPRGRKEEHRKIEDRYDFFMRRRKQDSIYCDWKSLLLACSDNVQCDELLSGSSLFAVEFGPLQATCLISGLSILCQGYLAVHCGPNPQNSDGFEVEVQYSKDEIRLALIEMRWGEFLKSGIAEDLLAPHLTASDPQGRQEMRNQVSSASYWNICDKMETQAMRNTIGCEWKAVSGKTFEGSKTAALVEALSAIPRPDLFSILVAEAFWELHILFGGAKHV